MKRKGLHAILKPYYIFALLLALWFVASWLEIWNTYLLPPPWKVARTFVTMLFDSVYTWCIPVLLSWLLCSYTSLSIFAIYFIVQFSDLIKVGIAIPMLRSGFWAKNIISGIDSKPNQA